MRSFGGALFCMLKGVYMNDDVRTKIIDITGVELMPGNPAACLGNGEQGFACCCDECDYYLLCFPEFIDSKSKEKDKDAAPSVTV